MKYYSDEITRIINMNRNELEHPVKSVNMDWAAFDEAQAARYEDDYGVLL